MLRLLSVQDGVSVVVDSIFVVASMFGEFCVWYMFCDVVLSILSRYGFILLRTKEGLLLCVFAVVLVSLPHGAVDWSVVCGCSISWSYSLINH